MNYHIQTLCSQGVVECVCCDTHLNTHRLWFESSKRLIKSDLVVYISLSIANVLFFT